MPIVEIKGYHGTDSISAKRILKGGFRSSIGIQHWLGDGIYFFVEGISPLHPIELASNWARAEAWNKIRRKQVYDVYAVLEADIKVDSVKLLDLTTKDGMEVFSYLRGKYVDAIVKTGKVRSVYPSEGDLINDARKRSELVVDMIIGDFYIKFEKERKFKIDFRTPNCSIGAVFLSHCIEKLTLVESNSFRL